MRYSIGKRVFRKVYTVIYRAYRIYSYGITQGIPYEILQGMKQGYHIRYFEVDSSIVGS